PPQPARRGAGRGAAPGGARPRPADLGAVLRLREAHIRRRYRPVAADRADGPSHPRDVRSALTCPCRHRARARLRDRDPARRARSNAAQLDLGPGLYVLREPRHGHPELLPGAAPDPPLRRNTSLAPDRGIRRRQTLDPPRYRARGREPGRDNAVDALFDARAARPGLRPNTACERRPWAPHHL